MEDQGNIKVVCRFRPLNEKEQQMSGNLCVKFLDDQTVSIISNSESSEALKFTYDKVFPPTGSQESVYDVSAKPIVEAVMQGFNGTVLAYGQTSSGKTFTMTGPNVDDPELMGIIPRMVNTVFDMIHNADDHLEFTVKVSYCEIYLEKIKDLLDVSKVNLKVHEERTRGVYIEDLSEKYVSSDIEVYNLMKTGAENREVAYTNMNAGSSRSHSIFIMTVSQTSSKDYSGKVGKLYLVDLAGSEKVGKTGASGKRLEEAKNINKSLTALGQVINSLTDGKSTHVPYRDSKLTRVLQDSLGGNSQTSLIVTCSPSPYNEAETVSSLRFGIRAKAIKNKPKVNREYTIAELKILVSKSQEEIDKRDKTIAKLEQTLKARGESLLDISFGYKNAEELEKFNYDEIVQEIQDLKEKLAIQVENCLALIEENSKIKNLIEDFENQNIKMSEKIQNYQQQVFKSQSLAKEQETLIQKLEITKETLEKNLEIAFKYKISTEHQLNERDVEINDLKKKLSRLSIPLKNDESSLKQTIFLLNEEKKTNFELKAKISELESLIDQIFSTEADKNIDQRLEILMTREQDKWEQEKKILINSLQNRVDKVIELEIKLDNAKDSYKSLESTLSSGSIDLKRKCDSMEKSLEQLINNFQGLGTENDRLSIELIFYKKEYDKVAKDNEKLREKLENFQACEESYEYRIKMLENELSQIYAAKERVSFSGNIRKYIRGGPDVRNSISLHRQSVV
jgi:kinesin family member 5